MTLILLACLGLYLLDNRKIKIALTCLLPAFVILPAFFRVERLQGFSFYAGMILICAAPVLEKILEGISVPEKNRETVPAAETGEEDILDNRKKWRMLIAGYILFALFAVFAVVSIIRLNSKINSIYDFSRNQQIMAEEQQKTIETLTRELSELKDSKKQENRNGE